MCLYMLMFFFNDTATTEIYTLSLHDALPILPPVRITERSRSSDHSASSRAASASTSACSASSATSRRSIARSEEHTSELQSRQYLVCRLLLEKKKAPCSSASHFSSWLCRSCV